MKSITTKNFAQLFNIGNTLLQQHIAQLFNTGNILKSNIKKMRF